MKNKVIYQVNEVKNFKELMNQTVDKYPDNIAYKFKEKTSKEEVIYKEVTYKKVKEDVQALGTALLNMGLENKKVALIANNCYQWCVSYLAITTSNIVVVPLDKALPEGEIENLILRSKVEAVIFEDKYSNIFKNISLKI